MNCQRTYAGVNGAPIQSFPAGGLVELARIADQSATLTITQNCPKPLPFAQPGEPLQQSEVPEVLSPGEIGRAHRHNAVQLASQGGHHVIVPPPPPILLEQDGYDVLVGP